MTRRSRLRKLGVIAGAALAAATSLSACGDDSSPGLGGSGSRTDGRIIVYNGATGNLTPNFNPFVDSANGGTRGVLYETLLFFNQWKANDIRPMLAEKYEVSDDGRTYTFNLRTNVKWHDGEVFDADDVVFTYNLLRDNKKVNTRAIPIEEARKVDQFTVEVELTRPAFADLWYVAGQTTMVPEHIWSKVKDPSADQNPKPVGTGPFKLEQFSAQAYTLEKNTAYWQAGKPKLNSMRFVSYSGNTSALTALNAGKIDWASIFIPDIERAYVAKNPDVNKYVNAPPAFVTNLVPNLDRWPTNQLPVRKAINQALDRERISRLAFASASPPAHPTHMQIPRDEEFIAPEYRGAKLPNDTAAAQKSLTDAGYTRGSDGIFRDPQGRKVAITCLVVTGYTDYISALQIMTEELKEAGIEFKYQELSYASWTAKRNTGDFQMVIDNAYGGPTAFYYYNYALNSKTTAPIGELATSNYARFRSPEADRLIAQAGGTLDPEKQKPAFAGLQKIMIEQLPYIPIIQYGALTEFRTAKITGFPTEDNPFALPITWAQPDIGIVAAELDVK